MFCITTPILTKKVMNGATKDALETLFQASSTPLTFGSLITFPNHWFWRGTPNNTRILLDGRW